MIYILNVIVIIADVDYAVSSKVGDACRGILVHSYMQNISDLGFVLVDYKIYIYIYTHNIVQMF